MAIDDTLNRTPRKNSFGDAAAAMSNPNVTQVQETTATAPKPMQTTVPSAREQMTALPSAAVASLNSRVSQIPTGA